MPSRSAWMSEDTMLSDRRPGKQRLPTGKLVDWLIPIVLFLVALIVYSAHFLTAPAGISGDAARLGLVAADWLYERLFPFYIYHQFAPNPLIVYLQAPMFAVLERILAQPNLSPNVYEIASKIAGRNE